MARHIGSEQSASVTTNKNTHSEDRIQSKKLTTFRLILTNATDLESTLVLPRVQVSSADVMSIEFARAIDVHRLMRAKEKRALTQRVDRSKRARVAPTAPRREVLVVEGVTNNRQS